MDQWKESWVCGNFIERKFSVRIQRTPPLQGAPGLLIKNSWNEILIRNFTNDGKGGFLGEAPSIQGYFLECILSGKWEFFENALNINPRKALKEKPKNAAFDNFSEANRIFRRSQ